MTTRKNTAAAALEAARDEGLELLKQAGRAASAAGEAAAAARDNRGSALDMAIVGLSAPGVLASQFTFDVKDRNGDIVEHVTADLIDYLAGFKHGDGKAYRAKETAFRGVALPLFFGVPGDQSAGAKSVWSTFGKAITAAAALVARDMRAYINAEGKLTVEGGEGPEAEALRKAQSASALVKAAKGETGTSRATPGNDKSDEGEGGRVATPAEIFAAAARLCEGVAKGDEAMCNAALSYARRIAALVAANPEAFAED
jgi:hypothetical protein